MFIVDNTNEPSESSYEISLDDPDAITKIIGIINASCHMMLDRMKVLNTTVKQLDSNDIAVDGMQMLRMIPIPDHINTSVELKPKPTGKLLIGEVGFTGVYPSAWVRFWQRFILGWKWERTADYITKPQAPSTGS